MLPQTWDKKKWPKFTKADHAEFVERLGNSLLLIGITNNKLKNKSWAEKKAAIQAVGVKQTPLTELALQETQWTKATITRLQKRIAGHAVTIWKG